MKNLFIIIASLLVISCSKSEYGWKWGKKYTCQNCSTEEWIRLEKPDQITVSKNGTENTYTFTITPTTSTGIVYSYDSYIYEDGAFTSQNTTSNTYK